MRNQDFMAGNFEFSQPGNPSAAVINEGLISAREAGLVGLVAPGVVNDGIIRARLGSRVGLASGNRFTLNVRGDGLFSFAPDDEVLEQVIDHRTGQPLKHLVSNNGLIEAPGGLVALSAVNTRLLMDSVIDNSGRILAPTYETQVGRVHFSTALPSQQRAAQQAAAAPQPRQKVTVSGTIDVSGRGENQTGGEILILGEVLGLTNATLDASGDAGGGLVLVGGGFMGGQATEADAERFGLDIASHDLPTATELTVDGATTITADALADGDGGTVVLWSDELTAIAGNLSARGGVLIGDGGLIETSSSGRLSFDGVVDLAAPSGRGGTWLLDPQRIAIVSFSNPSLAAIQERELSFGSSIIDTATIEATLNSGANVDIRTRTENPRTFILESPVDTGADTYEMSIYDEINKTSGGDATLSLSSFGRMQFFAGVTSSQGALDLNFSVGVHTRQDNPGLRLGSFGLIRTRPPYISKSTNYVFETNGGNVDLFSVANISGGIFDTAGGDFRAQTAGYYSNTEINFSSIQEGTYQSGEALSETDHGFAINTGSGDVYIDASTYNCPSCTFNFGRIRLSNNSIVSSGQVTLIAGPPDGSGHSVSGVSQGDGIPEIYTDLPVILGQDATLAAVQVAPYADYIPVSVTPTTDNPPELTLGSLSDINLVVGEAFTGLDFSDVFQDDGGFDALTVDITVDPLGIPVSFQTTSDGGSTALGLAPISEADWNRFGTTPGSYSVKITATDASGGTVSTTFNVIITAAPTLLPPPPTDNPPTASGLPTFTHTASVFGDVSLAVSRDYFADDNGNSNLTLSLRGGFSPPDGTRVSISPDGSLVVSGTIRTPGIYPVPVEATDASGQSVARTFVIVFDPGSYPAIEAVETETQTTTSLAVSTPTEPIPTTTGSNTSTLLPTEVAAIDPTADSQTVTENSDQPNIAVQSVVSAIQAGTTAIDGQRQEDANTSSGWVMPARAADNLRQAWELAGDSNQSPATAAEGVLRLLVASLDITLGTGAEAAGRIGSEAFELITEDLANLLSNEPRGFDRLSPQEQQYALELRALLQRHQELLNEAYEEVQEEHPVLTLTGELALYLSGARTAQIALPKKIDGQPNPNVANGSTRIVPGGGLQAHEAAGGHLIQRHVGQTDTDLVARLNAQPNISAASSFPNRATAETAVSSALDANSNRINGFLTGSRNRLVLDHDTGSVIGSVVQRGSTTPVSTTNVRVVLQRDASMPTGYRIVTGFPTP